MRSWHPIPPKYLDRQRLLAEHRELHSLFTVIAEDRDGWGNHPERLRWEGHLPALVLRHNEVVEEMKRRGYRHKTPLPRQRGRVVWPKTWQPLWEMEEILREKQEGSTD